MIVPVTVFCARDSYSSRGLLHGTYTTHSSVGHIIPLYPLRDHVGHSVRHADTHFPKHQWFPHRHARRYLDTSQQPATWQVSIHVLASRPAALLALAVMYATRPTHTPDANATVNEMALFTSAMPIASTPPAGLARTAHSTCFPPFPTMVTKSYSSTCLSCI